MSSLDEINRSIGRLEGKVDGILSQLNTKNEQDQNFDERLRDTEVKSARIGAVSGSLFSVALMFIKEVFTGPTGP